MSRAWLAASICLGFSGCAAPSSPSPLIELRPRLGTVAAVAEASGMPVVIGSPARGGADGALRGAGQGLLLGVAVGGGLATGTGSYGAAAGVLLGGATAIVAAPVAALFGAAQAQSQAAVEAAERSLKKVLAETPPSSILAEELRSLGKRVPVAATVDSAAPTAKARRAVPAPADTRLEVSVQRYGLARRGIGVADPDFQFFVEARARLVRAADGFEHYAHAWRYDGPRRSYFRWAENDGAPLRIELRLAAQRLAAAVVHHMFEAPSPSRRPLDVIDAVHASPQP